MNVLTHRLLLDMRTLTSQTTVHIKKCDTKNKLVISLTENGKMYEISAASHAAFVGKKPDGKIVFNDCIVVGNTIEYTITAQTSAAVGVVACELRLYDANTNLLTSPRFTIVVDEIIFNPDDIQMDSENEMNVLDALVDEATALIKNVETKLANGEFNGEKGDRGDAGASGVHIGTDTPPDTANVWINPEGDPTSTEDWEFDLDNGSTDTKKVVVVDSDEATANGKLAFLRMKDADGNWVEIPALIGSKGDKGEKGDSIKGDKGDDGFSPTHSWDGTVLTVTTASGTSSVDLKGAKGDRGNDGDSIFVARVTESNTDGGTNTVEFSDGSVVQVKNGAKGESGVTAPVSGFYTLSVDESGNLYVTSAEDGDAPDFEYDPESGNLYVMQGGVKALIGNVKGVKGDRGDTGATGSAGKDGTSVTVANVSESTADGGSNVVTFSDGKTLTIKNGSKGSTGGKGDTGAAGYTPQKNVDYFDGKDGANGTNGVSCTHSWNGTTLTVTSASGTSSANLKGEKGDKGDSIKGDKGDKGDTGEVDYSRLNDYLPLSGGTVNGELVLNNSNEASATNPPLTIISYISGDSGITETAKIGTFADSPYGIVIKNDPDGTSVIQSQRFAKDTENFTLSLNPFGGSVLVNGVPVALQSQLPTILKETWTFTLEDGSTVTKQVHIG